MMGMPDAAALLAALAAHRSFVAAQFDAIFSEKVQDGDEAPDSMHLQSSDGEADLDNLAAIEARLAGLGFDDAGGAARRLLSTWHAPRLQAMPEASRTRLLALLNAALPLISRVVLEAGVGRHSATLSRLLDFFEAVARRSSYLSLLTEYPHTLERVIRMMNASGWAATFLAQHPILLDAAARPIARRWPPNCRVSSMRHPATPSGRWTSCAIFITPSCSACWRWTWPVNCRSKSLPITCRRWPT
jgi:glutamate-ammonia-ligase adenylyltransferase